MVFDEYGTVPDGYYPGFNVAEGRMVLKGADDGTTAFSAKKGGVCVGLPTPEGAARAVLSALFGVPQYSMVLGRLPESHRRMVRHWIGFATRHRKTLLQGVFRPHHPELFYPLIEAESDAERIVAAYGGASVVAVPDATKPCWAVNATEGDGLFVTLPAAARIRLFDTFGTCTATVDEPSGPARLAVPKSGCAEIRFGISSGALTSQFPRR